MACARHSHTHGGATTAACREPTYAHPRRLSATPGTNQSERVPARGSRPNVNHDGPPAVRPSAGAARRPAGARLASTRGPRLVPGGLVQVGCWLVVGVLHPGNI